MQDFLLRAWYIDQTIDSSLHNWGDLPKDNLLMIKIRLRDGIVTTLRNNDEYICVDNGDSFTIKLYAPYNNRSTGYIINKSTGIEQWIQSEERTSIFTLNPDRIVLGKYTTDEHYNQVFNEAEAWR